MSRIRSIHPGLWTDEAFMSLSAYARLLFIGLWNEAFDDGAFEWKPLTLKAKLFPVDTVDVRSLLAELVVAGCIREGGGTGKQYGLIRNFRVYQRPKKPNSSGLLQAGDDEYVGLVPNQFGTGGGKPPQMEDGGEGVEEQEEPTNNISLIAEREFEDWYAAYPRHVGKGAARKAYRTARKKASADELMAAAVRATEQYRGKEEQFVPHPSSWLNAERWLDQAPPKRDWRDDPDMRGVL